MQPTTTPPSAERLLASEEERLAVFPIRYPQIWARYKKALASRWVAGEVDLSKDPADWKRLTDGERHFLSHVLGFFASADGIVNDNLAERFGSEVKIREAKFFYDLQKMMENIHSEMYSLLIDTLIAEPTDRHALLHAAEHVPCVRAKAQWAQRWITSEESFAKRLVAFAVVEGVFFSGSFCAIFWLKKRGLMPGLCVSNTLIARDEGMHQEFATFLYSEMLEHKLPEASVHEIVSDAVDHEIEFCTDALPVSLIGMNATDMAQYIRFVADRLLTELGVGKLYHAANPFDWMEYIALENKTNFFEHRVSEYRKVGARTDGDDHTFALDAAF
jgi:ribonucleoside-diphosphate reductase beta chain